MKTKSNSGARWLTVVVFAIAMAWVESAVVFYLRSMVNRIQPYQPDPLPFSNGFGMAELVREAATLVMLLMVGILAGKTWRSRMGYAAIAFGIWDIFYYVFLKVMCDWPRSFMDWDILFLLPMPWWGPVLAPISVALLMIMWGTLASGWEESPRKSSWRVWALNFIGAALALYLFMADNIRVARQGVEAWRKMLPTAFEWPLFCLALLLMAAPIFQVLWQLWEHRRRNRPVLDYDKWLEHFRRNQEHRPAPDWSQLILLPPGVLPPLLRSLEQFQLGDGGGPASLIARDAERFRGATPQMRALVDHWFAEEREHSRLVGAAVDRLGGNRISSHWSFTAFCQCRRILGVRFELQVLLLTEITSTAYYRLLQRHSPIPALATMCGLILRDEGGHIAFHRDRLAAAGRTPRGLTGALWAAQFWLCGYAAATMLWINHRPAFLPIGGTTPEFYREVRIEIGRFLRALVRQSGISRTLLSRDEERPVRPLTALKQS
jgi:hypothetical protein